MRFARALPAVALASALVVVGIPASAGVSLTEYAADVQADLMLRDHRATTVERQLENAEGVLAEARESLDAAREALDEAMEDAGEFARWSYRRPNLGSGMEALGVATGSTSFHEMSRTGVSTRRASVRFGGSIDSAMAAVATAEDRVASSEERVSQLTDDLAEARQEADEVRQKAHDALVAAGIEETGESAQETPVQQRVLNDAAEMYMDSREVEFLPKDESLEQQEQRESVAAAALGLVGDRVEAEFSCASVTASLWGGLPATPRDQLLATQEVDAEDVRIGDLVFEFSDGDDPHGVGVYIGAGHMVSTMREVVSVEPWLEGVVTRPGLGIEELGADSLQESDIHCGDLVNPSDVDALPEPENEVDGLDALPTHIDDAIEALGDEVPSSARSEGDEAPWPFTSTESDDDDAEFAYRELEPDEDSGMVTSPLAGVVVAAADGSVTAHHPGGGVSVYTGVEGVTVREGSVVIPGSPVGTPGDEFRAVLATAKDTPYLTEGVVIHENVDGYLNGRLPDSALSQIDGLGAHHRLQADAARALEALRAAYAEDHGGRELPVTDTYRDYAGQVACKKAKPVLCATPGTSNHGWGLAVDFGGSVNRFSGPDFRWMVENAGRFGWVHPWWAGESGSKPEPWHWEYGDTSELTSRTIAAVTSPEE